MFDDLRRAVQTIDFLADPTAGEVRIGSSALLAASFVAAVVDRLSQRYPGIVFHLVTGQALHRELTGRNVDLLIVRRFGPIADERLDFEFLFDDLFVIAAGAQNPWVRRRKVELADLADEFWVLPPAGSVIASVVKEAFRAKGLDYPRTRVVTESLRGSNQPVGNRALCRNFPGFGVTVPDPALGNKSFARQIDHGSAAKRNRNTEKPRTRPRRAAFHRLRPRDGQATGEQKVTRTSGIVIRRNFELVSRTIGVQN